MSMNDIVSRALDILEEAELWNNNHDSIDRFIEAKDQSSITTTSISENPSGDYFQQFDDLVKDISTRNISSFTSQEDDGKSFELEFVEFSAQKSQALVSLDYFNERFKSDLTLKEMVDVSSWIDEAARNHSNFLFQLELKKRSDAERNLIDEDDELTGHLHHLDVAQIYSFGELKEDYLSRNNDIFKGLLMQCAETKKMWREELQEMISACERDQRVAWDAMHRKYREVSSDITRVRELHEALDSKIANAPVTQKAILKIVDDRFRASFQQITKYVLLQEERIAEMNDEMKKMSRDIGKLKGIMYDLNAKRFRPDKLTFNRARYLVSDIARDIKVKEKKAGLSLTSKLKNNKDILEQLVEDSDRTVERRSVLLEQEKSIYSELNTLVERLPKLKATARTSMENLKSQLEPLQVTLIQLENVVAECGRMASEAIVLKQNKPLQTPVNQKSTSNVIFRQSPFIYLEQLHNLLLTISGNDVGLRSDDLYVASACEDWRDELVEKVLNWKVASARLSILEHQGDKALVLVSQRLQNRRRLQEEAQIIESEMEAIDHRVDEATEMRESVCQENDLASSILGGCYVTYGAVVERKRQAGIRIRAQAAAAAAAASNISLAQATPKRSTRFLPSSMKQVIATAVATGGPITIIDQPVNLDSVTFSIAEYVNAFQQIIVDLHSLKCLPTKYRTNQILMRLCEISRDLNIRDLSITASEELLSFGIEILNTIFCEVPRIVLVKNKKRVLAKILHSLFAVVHVVVDLISSADKSAWSEWREKVSNVNYVESILLRLISYMVSEPWNLSIHQAASANQTTDAADVMRRIRQMMMDLVDALGGPNSQAKRNAQATDQTISIRDKFTYLEHALCIISECNDTHELPSVEMLYKKIEQRIATRRPITDKYWKSLRGDTQYFTLFDRNTLGVYQIFLATLFADSSQAFANTAMNSVLRCARTGFRLTRKTEDGMRQPFRSDELEETLFPVTDGEKFVKEALPLFLPLFILFDILRRTIEVDISRLIFLQYLCKGQSLSKYSDLRYLNVSNSSQICGEMRKAAMLSRKSRVGRRNALLGGKRKTTKRTTPANGFLTIDAASGNYTSIPMKPDKTTEELDPFHEPTTAAEIAEETREWEQEMVDYVETLAEDLADNLWGCGLRPGGSNHLMQGLPIAEALKDRVWMLVERIREYSSVRHTRITKDLITSLQAEFEECLRELIKNRGLLASSANSFVRPWQQRAEWLKHQYDELWGENKSSFDELAKIRQDTEKFERRIQQASSDLREIKLKKKTVTVVAPNRSDTSRTRNIEQHGKQTSILTPDATIPVSTVEILKRRVTDLKLEVERKSIYLDKLALSKKKIETANRALMVLRQSFTEPTRNEIESVATKPPVYIDVNEVDVTSNISLVPTTEPTALDTAGQEKILEGIVEDPPTADSLAETGLAIQDSSLDNTTNVNDNTNTCLDPVVPRVEMKNEWAQNKFSSPNEVLSPSESRSQHRSDSIFGIDILNVGHPNVAPSTSPKLIPNHADVLRKMRLTQSGRSIDTDNEKRVDDSPADVPIVKEVDTDTITASLANINTYQEIVRRETLFLQLLGESEFPLIATAEVDQNILSEVSTSVSNPDQYLCVANDSQSKSIATISIKTTERNLEPSTGQVVEQPSALFGSAMFVTRVPTLRDKPELVTERSSVKFPIFSSTAASMELEPLTANPLDSLQNLLGTIPLNIVSRNDFVNLTSGSGPGTDLQKPHRDDVRSKLVTSSLGGKSDPNPAQHADKRLLFVQGTSQSDKRNQQLPGNQYAEDGNEIIEKPQVPAESHLVNRPESEDEGNLDGSSHWLTQESDERMSVDYDKYIAHSTLGVLSMERSDGGSSANGARLTSSSQIFVNEHKECDYVPQQPVIRISTSRTPRNEEVNADYQSALSAANISGLVQSEQVKKYKELLEFPSRKLDKSGKQSRLQAIQNLINERHRSPESTKDVMRVIQDAEQKERIDLMQKVAIDTERSQQFYARESFRIESLSSSSKLVSPPPQPKPTKVHQQTKRIIRPFDSQS